VKPRSARYAPPSSATARSLSCPPEIADLRVLVVDDEDDTREMLHSLLQGCRVDVRLAASAAEALAAVRTEPPDLLLSDIGMPGEDGLSLIAQVRALPPESGGRIPAVALTAYARMEDRARALHAGFDNHVAKPVEPIELLAVISSFARRRR